MGTLHLNELVIRAEIKGTGTSSYTRQNVEDRLAALDGVHTEEAREERAFLLKVMEKRGWT